MNPDYPHISGHVTAVARRFVVSADLLLSRARPAHVTRARHVLYWLLRHDGLSLPQIGRLLERDHTTVLHGINRVDEDAELLRLAWSLASERTAA